MLLQLRLVSDRFEHSCQDACNSPNPRNFRLERPIENADNGKVHDREARTVEQPCLAIR